MEYEQYAEYVANNTGMFAEEVNKSFERSKDLIKGRILNEIRKNLTPIPEHFEWSRGECRYDSSGYLKEKGLISLNQTLYDFLNNEYTGASMPTYESGHGLNYCTYGDDLSIFTLDLACNYMRQTIKSIIESKFNISLTEDDMLTIGEGCDDYDRIYDACIASEFFFWEGPVEFCGIGGMQLSDIISKK
ncbi:hypothetical protein [Butyrivibrio sp.]|uniref:hypothetical protein n=1 Tax=Butyrivibrio sp. TaxID=28121 RepID=UPI0025B9FEE1|nr:hypothetical protein [Butyrivibrio sp.]MBQ7431330.1 hypothetical protein [Butyrivibrio sp.]MBQ9302730.1 hypothetical protein [Butyrivibrio sp.]